MNGSKEIQQHTVENFEKNISKSMKYIFYGRACFLFSEFCTCRFTAALHFFNKCSLRLKKNFFGILQAFAIITVRPVNNVGHPASTINEIRQEYSNQTRLETTKNVKTNSGEIKHSRDFVRIVTPMHRLE